MTNITPRIINRGLPPRTNNTFRAILSCNLEVDFVREKKKKKKERKRKRGKKKGKEKEKKERKVKKKQRKEKEETEIFPLQDQPYLL